MLQEYIDIGLIPSSATATTKPMIFVVNTSQLKDVNLPDLQHELNSTSLEIEQDRTGLIKVCAYLHWGRKKAHVTIKSRLHTNYQAALLEVYVLASTVATDDIVCADTLLDELLTVKRSHNNPSFTNIVDVGLPLFTCSIRHNQKIFVSSPHKSKRDALLEIATLLNELPVPQGYEYIDIDLLPPSAQPVLNSDTYSISQSEQAKQNLPKLEHKKTTLSLEIIKTEYRKPKVVAILQWGNGKCINTIKSKQYTNYQAALKDVYALANTIPADDLGDPCIILNKLQKVNFKYTRPVFENVVETGIPSYKCSVSVAGDIYVSQACKTKRESVEELAKKLNLLPPSKLQGRKENSSEKRAKVQDVLKTKKPVDNTAAGILKRMIIRWRREHSWLLSKKYKVEGDSSRVHELSLYLAMLDPLRKLEVTPLMRAKLAPEMESELREHIKRETKKGKNRQLVAYLRLMLNSKSMTPGDSVVMSAKFVEKASRNGDDPEDIKMKLISSNYLRSYRETEIKLTTNGVTLIERDLKSGYDNNTLGSSLPEGTLFSILSILPK